MLIYCTLSSTTRLSNALKAGQHLFACLHSLTYAPTRIVDGNTKETLRKMAQDALEGEKETFGECFALVDRFMQRKSYLHAEVTLLRLLGIAEDYKNTARIGGEVNGRSFANVTVYGHEESVFTEQYESEL